MTYNKFNLQLFADGTAAATTGAEGIGVTSGANAEGATGETALRTKRGTLIKSSVAPKVDTSLDKGAEESGEQKEADKAETVDKKSFDDLLLDEEFEKEHKKRIEDAVKRRHKDYNNIKEENDKLNKLRRYLAVELGVDYDDLDGMVAKSEEGRKEAIRRKSVETGDSEELIARNEENAYKAQTYKEQLDAIREKGEADRFNMRIDKELNEARTLYPNLDWETETQNPAFNTLIKNGFSVQNAYEAVHTRDIISGAVASAVQEAKLKFSNNIASGVQRPAEGGMSKSSAAKVEISPKNMTKEQRADIKRRVRNGERIEKFF